MTLDGKKPKPDILRAEAAIAALAMAYPETTEDNPWGHRAFKVKGKTFLFTASDSTGLGISVKLPQSGVLALELPFTEPTGYGMGKSGWVSARWTAGKDVPVALVSEWLTESYRAIAPKKLAATLTTAPPSKAPSRPKPKPTKPKAKRPKPKRRLSPKRSKSTHR